MNRYNKHMGFNTKARLMLRDDLVDYLLYFNHELYAGTLDYSNNDHYRTIIEDLAAGITLLDMAKLGDVPEDMGVEVRKFTTSLQAILLMTHFKPEFLQKKEYPDLVKNFNKQNK